MIKERIDNELKEAMKNKDEIKISCLRMLKADMQNRSIQTKEDLKQEDILKIIQKQVRQHKDSIEQFKKANRDDLVEKEKKELSILESFLPNKLPQEELEKIIREIIAELGVSTKKDMGRVIKEVMSRTKGQADGKTVSQIVSSLLN